MTRLKRTLALTLSLSGMVAGHASALITIDSVYVGDIGNPNDATTGFGSVDYGYGVGKYEVTVNQYCAFLNAVGTTDTYGLYNTYMVSHTTEWILGIVRNGASGSYSYSVAGSGARPVTFVSWFDAARFVNWLHNGQPTGLQTAATTEGGAYTLNGATSGAGFTKNAGAEYWIPSENEWYKAAYYQPAAQGGDGDGYWRYPMRSNGQPNSRNGSATDPNSANYYYNDGIANGYNGGFAVNNSTTMPTVNTLTDVGAFSQADSFYGTFDQGGNVWEWNDAVIGSARGMRGGSWLDLEDTLRASARGDIGPSYEDGDMGFRVAIVPEPSVGVMMIMGMVLLARVQKQQPQAKGILSYYGAGPTVSGCPAS